jgi:hypothetical protein
MNYFTNKDDSNNKQKSGDITSDKNNDSNKLILNSITKEKILE